MFFEKETYKLTYLKQIYLFMVSLQYLFNKLVIWKVTTYSNKSYSQVVYDIFYTISLSYKSII